MRDVTGRVPAHDLDAEAAVLSAVLVAGQVDAVSDLLEPADFYSDANKRIFEAALEIRRGGVPIDVVTVARWLRDRELLASVGGAGYLGQIADATPAVAHLDAHARIVSDKAKVRRLVAECQRIAAEGYGDVGDVAAWVDSAESAIHAIGQSRQADTMTDLRQAIHDFFDKIAHPPETPDGLSTGLSGLDRILGPMCAGQLILIGALSGIGKSSLALNMALHVACEAKSGVLIFSAEMEAVELASRALFSDAQVDAWKANYPKRIDAGDWQRLTASAAKFSTARVLVDDRPNITPLQIRSAARRVQSRREFGLGLIVVDYIQLLDGKANLPKGASRENEVAEIARSLKVLAKETGVPVLALAQLNSDSERAPNGGRKPRMNDLRESKAIAQNADKIILIHNPHAVERAETYRNENGDEAPFPAECVDLIVAKNRGGRTGTAQADFWPSCTLFAESS